MLFFHLVFFQRDFITRILPYITCARDKFLANEISSIYTVWDQILVFYSFYNRTLWNNWRQLFYKQKIAEIFENFIKSLGLTVKFQLLSFDFYP